MFGATLNPILFSNGPWIPFDVNKFIGFKLKVQVPMKVQLP